MQYMLFKLKLDVNDFDVVACTLKGLTAHYLLHLTFDLKSGMTALVHAAAGGVGQLMGQWGNEIGATNDRNSWWSRKS